MKKFCASLLVGVLLAMLITGCKKAEPVVEESSVVVQEESSVVEESSIVEESSEEVAEESLEESTKEAEIIKRGPMNPLTGEATEADLTGNRPYVFMCNDLVVAMPMCGVSQADMIMEMMDEGGITRFMVWFMDPSQVEKIGSVRSARIYNVETAIGYDALLCHCGGSPEALSYILDNGIEDLDAVYSDWAGVYYRDESRQTYGIEHSMFARGTHLANAIEKYKDFEMVHSEEYDGTYGMIFSETAVEQCTEKAEDIFVRYAGGKTTTFKYNEETKAYTMYQYDMEYTDDWRGGIPFANVINMYATTWLQDDGCHLGIDLSSGEGTFFTEGKAVAIKWYSDGLEDCFHFTLEDGTPLEFSVGKTFFCVNQCGSDIYTGTCEWE